MKLLRPPRCALFDLDGVLLDTERLYTEATQAVVGRYGRTYDWTLKRHIMGRDPVLGARYVIDQLDLPLTPDELLAARRPILEDLMRRAEAMPGAEAFVRQLATLGIPMAVATSSESSLCELKIAGHPFFGFFRTRVCGDDPRVRRRKPAPDIFLVAARELGIPPQDCVVFEDSHAGVEAARAAGMQVVALPDPALDRTSFSPADLIVGGFGELHVENLGLG